MSVSRYDIVHVPEIRTAGDGLPAYGNGSHNYDGEPNPGPRGHPVIEISDMGLADMDTAVLTIWHRIARKGVESSTRLGRHLWVVERTVSWLAGCRRLHRRYERMPEHFPAFVGIAALRI